jgi:hypothetical protein
MLFAMSINNPIKKNGTMNNKRVILRLPKVLGSLDLGAPEFWSTGRKTSNC